MENCKLEILTATLGEEGLQRLAAIIAPPTEGVRYLVSCQCPGYSSLPVPPALQRDDVRIIFTSTKGVAINRNNALTHATAPLCLLSDDDVHFTPDAFQSIISVFKHNPDVDVATFKFLGPGGSFEKPYPNHTFSLNKPEKGYYVSAIEVAFRLKSVKNTGIWFNENFGVGTERFASGEEELWVHDLLHTGLKGQFFPHLIATHKHCNSTGIRLMASPPVLRAQGAIIKRFYPRTALLRVILKGWRSSKATQVSILSCLIPLLSGWWQATTRPRKLFGSK
ncbi:MAG: glycosyltransferase family 2 protein [Muribaculaceae bacterium]|nr:glycosyltransferase family 2 protein [Muribaculaceae bacterium]